MKKSCPRLVLPCRLVPCLLWWPGSGVPSGFSRLPRGTHSSARREIVLPLWVQGAFYSTPHCARCKIMVLNSPPIFYLVSSSPNPPRRFYQMYFMKSVYEPVLSLTAQSAYWCFSGDWRMALYCPLNANKVYFRNPSSLLFTFDCNPAMMKIVFPVWIINPSNEINWDRDRSLCSNPLPYQKS